jgi:hypothetical protein
MAHKNIRVAKEVLTALLVAAVLTLAMWSLSGALLLIFGYGIYDWRKRKRASTLGDDVRTAENSEPESGSWL